MGFLTKEWLETQLENFAVKIGSVFVKKDDLKKYTPIESGFYKISVDENGNVDSVEPVTKEDIVRLGIVAEYIFTLDEEGNLYYEPKQETEGG